MDSIFSIFRCSVIMFFFLKSEPTNKKSNLIDNERRVTFDWRWMTSDISVMEKSLHERCGFDSLTLFTNGNKWYVKHCDDVIQNGGGVPTYWDEGEKVYKLNETWNGTNCLILAICHKRLFCPLIWERFRLCLRQTSNTLILFLKLSMWRNATQYFICL